MIFQMILLDVVILGVKLKHKEIPVLLISQAAAMVELMEIVDSLIALIMFWVNNLWSKLHIKLI